jgi:hypothetical protein
MRMFGYAGGGGDLGGLFPTAPPSMFTSHTEDSPQNDSPYVAASHATAVLIQPNPKQGFARDLGHILPVRFTPPGTTPSTELLRHLADHFVQCLLGGQLTVTGGLHERLVGIRSRGGPGSHFLILPFLARRRTSRAQ